MSDSRSPGAAASGFAQARKATPYVVAMADLASRIDDLWDWIGFEKVLTLPEAIRKMTSWAATRMRIPNRGTIKEGNWADVVIFDYDKIQDRATYEQPTLPPVGIEYVLVNGQVVMENGKHTGARPGKIIYGQGRQIP